jgi:hypothetical protein
MYLAVYDWVSTVGRYTEQVVSRFRSEEIFVTDLNIGEMKGLRVTKGSAKRGFKSELDVP